MRTISRALSVVDHKAYLGALKTLIEIGSSCFMPHGAGTAKNQSLLLPNLDKNSDKSWVTKKISWLSVSLIGINILIQYEEWKHLQILWSTRISYVHLFTSQSWGSLWIQWSSHNGEFLEIRSESQREWIFQTTWNWIYPLQVSAKSSKTLLEINNLFWPNSPSFPWILCCLMHD